MIKLSGNCEEELLEIFSNQKKNRINVAATSAYERIIKLKKLKNAVLSLSKEIEEAIYLDFNKSSSEVRLTEIYMVVTEINHTIRHLKKWIKPKRVIPPLTFFGAGCRIRYEPKGLCLIMSPWNYPFGLATGPLVPAIAAGNCVMLKPSEYTPNTSVIIKKLLENLFEKNEIAVVEGDMAVGKFLTEMPFNHIFFTGSPAVGKIVMKAASKNLASVTLELGGKSPVIISESADFNETAKKIVWGKLLNCGQTCTSPDYVLLPKNKTEIFINFVKEYITKYYGKPENLEENPDYCRIVSRKHYSRIKNLIRDTVNKGAKIETGNICSDNTNFISPTVISNIPPDSKIMEEEIFGPVLPVLTYDTMEEALKIINSKANPLVIYIFSRQNNEITHILENTCSGDVVVNDTVLHYGNIKLPFGGFNNSGIGKYHGEEGFKSFSHIRSILKQPKWTIAGMLYPPYTSRVKKLIDLTIRYF